MILTIAILVACLIGYFATYPLLARFVPPEDDDPTDVTPVGVLEKKAS